MARRRLAVLIAVILAVAACETTQHTPSSMASIDHVIIIISPLAKRGHVDHTRYDTTAILKLIATRWGLAPLGARDAAQDGLTGAF